MEVYDPLADVPPPRYAVESDDEDEYNPLSLSRPSASTTLEQVNVEVKTIYDTMPRRRPLIFASGEAGGSWAEVVNLGEQRANIYANDFPVGLVFCPSWTSAIIITSETEDHARLPLHAMTTYVTAIIDHFQPTSVAILDSYSTQAYISSRVISQDTAPIRYLSIGKKPISDSGLELFIPPNLLQSTTASSLNILYLRSLREESGDANIAAILLPSPKIPRPPPTTFNSRGTIGDFADTIWEGETLEKAHKWLFAIIGEEAGESTLRPHAESVVRSTGITRSAFEEVGEGGMYI